MSERSYSSKHCLFLLRSPTDSGVYRCFRSLAQRWRAHVQAERLWIEGDVPIEPCLTAETPSPTLAKLLEADRELFARLELVIGGLQITYTRSGGLGPSLYRESYFDDVRLEIVGPLSISDRDMRQITAELYECLEVGAVRGVAELAGLTEELPIRLKIVEPETRA